MAARKRFLAFALLGAILSTGGSADDVSDKVSGWCGMNTRSPCVFPFTYRDTEYNSCSDGGVRQQPNQPERLWCYTNVEKKEWETCMKCDDTCKTPEQITKCPVDEYFSGKILSGFRVTAPWEMFAKYSRCLKEHCENVHFGQLITSLPAMYHNWVECPFMLKTRSCDMPIVELKMAGMAPMSGYKGMNLSHVCAAECGCGDCCGRTNKLCLYLPMTQESEEVIVEKTSKQKYEEAQEAAQNFTIQQFDGGTIVKAGRPTPAPIARKTPSPTPVPPLDENIESSRAAGTKAIFGALLAALLSFVQACASA